MKITKSLMALLMAGLLFSCQGMSKEEKEILAKAYETQKEVIEVIESIEEDLMSGLSEQERDSLHTLIEEIEESLVEIEGYELELEGHEGHDHSHDHDVELTAEETLAVQQELLRQVNQIKSDLTK